MRSIVVTQPLLPTSPPEQTRRLSPLPEADPGMPQEPLQTADVAPPSCLLPAMAWWAGAVTRLTELGPSNSCCARAGAADGETGEAVA